MARSRPRRDVGILAVLMVTTCLIIYLMNSHVSNSYFMLHPKARVDIKDSFSVLQPRATKEIEVDISKQPHHPESGMLLSRAMPCRMQSCFDYSHCSLNSGFPAYFYTDKELAPLSTTFQLSPVNYDISQRMYGTRDPDRSCVFVVAVGEMVGNQNSLSGLESVLRSLPYWKNEGRNHLVVSFAKHDAQLVWQGQTGQALVAGPTFLAGFREDFDIIIPPRPEPVKGALWTQLPPLFPIQRKHLVSFWGQYVPTPEEENDQLQGNLKTSVTSDLQVLQTAQGSDLVTSCRESKSAGWPTEWALCGTAAERSSQLSLSTFVLLLTPLDESLASTLVFQTRLQETLRNEAVPVIVGPCRRLPFGEIINWQDISVCLPFLRLRDLISILNSFNDNDVFEFRRLGRFVFENYFSSTEQILLAALTVVRFRLRIPAAPVPEDRTSIILSYHDRSPNEAFKTDGNAALSALRIPSPRFQRNFTYSLEQRMLNRPGYPFFLFPSTPFEPVLPSESKVFGKTNIPNQAFDDHLGGNVPQEQFTMLINSYQRPYAVLAAVRRLKGLRYLNKVVVIWVDPIPPSPDLLWPVIHVPVVVIRINGTSLNVRYQPFDVIETDCVFSLDDDLKISHKFIVNAFRMWRTERDNIVAFKVPCRALVWNKQTQLWEFCEKCPYTEYAPVLPTMALFHKMYLYLYTYVMPQAIRDLVTEKRNCEDFAMAFLVAHICRKPGRVVTSDVTFECPKCDLSNRISQGEGHFEKRSHCINFFIKVYGYFPLLFHPRGQLK